MYVAVSLDGKQVVDQCCDRCIGRLSDVFVVWWRGGREINPGVEGLREEEQVRLCFGMAGAGQRGQDRTGHQTE
jgi:hypothetical protein